LQINKIRANVGKPYRNIVNIIISRNRRKSLETVSQSKRITVNNLATDVDHQRVNNAV